MRARPATLEDVDAICRICGSVYTPDRVARELVADPPAWGGWFVAEDDVVVAAGAGGMTGPATAELFVLHVDRGHRGEGAGTALLRAITAQQRGLGATEQWVSVALGNIEGMRFYEGRGFARRGTQAAFELDGGTARYRRSLSGQGSGNPEGPG